LQSSSDTPRSPLPALADFFLPPGFPDAVSPDYLRYALLSYPVHVTGWLSHSLATAALLRAVGAGPELAAAAPGAAPVLTAAAKWVLKDGLGAFGRLAVAGRVAGLLDSAPRQWRLYAEAAAAAGGALEVSTLLAPPEAFLALAAGGTALRAAAGAVAKPAHSVILAHLATPGLSSLGVRRASNLGAVGAKEEVQEVVANLSGLALSLLLLQGAELPPAQLVGGWAAVSAAHIGLRYAALRGLVFRSLNARRAAAAAAAHVAGAAPGWASFAALNAAEPAFMPGWAMARRTHLGACCEEAGVGARGERELLASLRLSCELLASERFRLAWRIGPAGGDVWVFLTTAATPRDVMRGAWLAARLFAAGPGAGGPAALAEAAAALDKRFERFEAELRAESWDVSPLRDLPRARLYSAETLAARAGAAGAPAPADGAAREWLGDSAGR